MAQGLKISQLLNIDEFGAEQRGQFLDLMITKPDSQLGAMMQRILTDKIDDSLRERKTRETVVIHELLSQKDQNKLMEIYPEFNIVFKDDKNMVHGFAAAERKLQALLLMARVPKLEPVDDIGGQWSFWLSRGDRRVHSSCPLIDMRDKQRELQRQNFLRVFRDNATTSETRISDDQFDMYNAFKGDIDAANFVRCNSTFQDCNCRGYRADGTRIGATNAIALHSLYDFKLDDVADAMIEKGTKFLHAAMLFAPEAEIEREGPLPSVDGYYERKEGSLISSEKIFFGFNNDPSYAYIHDWSEYKKYLRGEPFSRRGHVFMFEPWQARGDTMFFTLYRMTGVPMTNLLGNEYYRRLYISRWEGMVVVPVFEIDEITKKLTKSSMYVEKAYMDKCLDYVSRLSDQQLTINNVKSFMSSNNWVLFINGAAVKNKQSVDPRRLQLLAQTLLVKEKLMRPLMTEMREKMVLRATAVNSVTGTLKVAWSNYFDGSLRRKCLLKLAQVLGTETGLEVLEVKDAPKYIEINDYLTAIFNETTEITDESLPDLDEAKRNSDKISKEAAEAAVHCVKMQFPKFESSDSLKEPLIRKIDGDVGQKRKQRRNCGLLTGWTRLLNNTHAHVGWQRLFLKSKIESESESCKPMTDEEIEAALDDIMELNNVNLEAYKSRTVNKEFDIFTAWLANTYDTGLDSEKELITNLLATAAVRNKKALSDKLAMLIDVDDSVNSFLRSLSDSDDDSTDVADFSASVSSDTSCVSSVVFRPIVPPGFEDVNLRKGKTVIVDNDAAESSSSSEKNKNHFANFEVVENCRFGEAPKETGDFSVDSRLEFIHYLRCLICAQNNELLGKYRDYEMGVVRPGGKGYPDELGVFDLALKKWIIKPPSCSYNKAFVPDVSAKEQGKWIGYLVDASWGKQGIDAFSCYTNVAWKADIAIVCSQTFLCNERIILKNLAGLEVIPLQCKFKLVDGVPGCGKSTMIVNTANPVFDVVLSTCKEATEDLLEKFAAKKIGINLKKRVKTVDSFLMHCSDGNCVGDILHFDEALMAHAGMVFFCAQIAKAKKVICQGDQKQIAYKPRVSQLTLKFTSLIGRFDEVEEKRMSYRCPVDVALTLDRFYTGKVVTKNPVLRSMDVKRIGSKEQVEMEHGIQYLTFLQSEKKDIANLLCQRKVKSFVNTVHEAQGKTFKKVRLVRLKPTDDVLARGQEYQIVALSRHTQSLVYETVKDDEVSALIRDSAACTKSSLMRYFVEDAMK
nr:replicase [Pea early-browning virus]